jgi:hypothetical protein
LENKITYGANGIFSFFLHFSFLFLKKPQKIAKLYIWRRGGRWQGPTTVPHGGRRRRESLFKNLQFICLNSDGDKLYIKIVAFDDTYNFIVQSFFI